MSNNRRDFLLLLFAALCCGLFSLALVSTVALTKSVLALIGIGVGVVVASGSLGVVIAMARGDL